MTYQMKIDENLNTISKSVEECFFNSFEHRLESNERNPWNDHIKSKESDENRIIHAH